MMNDNDVVYYQILDNYTIWRLETIVGGGPSSHPHPPPLRTLSFPTNSFQHQPENQSSVHLSHDVPLHKKRNLAKNLRAMIAELQQKVEKIEAEVNDQDIVPNILQKRSRPQQIETKNESNTGNTTQCNEPSECEHFNELLVVKRQLEAMSKDKNYLEEQIVKLRLGKSSDQGTDSEKRVSKLETENNLLKEKLRISFEKLSSLNREKCQELSNKFNKISYAPDVGRLELREFQTRLIKSLDDTTEVKRSLKMLREVFQTFQHWMLSQLKQGELFLKKVAEQGNAIQRDTKEDFQNSAIFNSNNKSNFVRSRNFHPRISTNRPIYDDPEIPNFNKTGNGPVAAERSPEVKSDFVEIVDRVIAESVSPEKRHNPAGRGIGTLYRIHPALSKGTRSSLSVNLPPSPNGLAVIQVLHNNRIKHFECDHVVGASPSQEELFELLKPTISTCYEGSNVCIFLYGETGSGKTYTAEGSTEHAGLLSMCFEELLRFSPSSTSLTCSVVELRNEVFRDILDPIVRGNYLETKQNPDGSISFNSWTRVKISSKEDYVEQVISRCQAVRRSHNCNLSHIIYTLSLHLPSINNKRNSSSVNLNIIDLAGSERMDKLSQDPSRIKEIQNVTKALTCLGDVLQAINSKQWHVPYRSSKLTHILQHSLQTSDRSELIVHLRADEYSSSETNSSLMFGRRVRGVDAGSTGTKALTKISSRTESQLSTPRPRRPSVGYVNPAGLPDMKGFTRRNSTSSERNSIKKLSLTPQLGSKY